MNASATATAARAAGLAFFLVIVLLAAAALGLVVGYALQDATADAGAPAETRAAPAITDWQDYGERLDARTSDWPDYGERQAERHAGAAASDSQVMTDTFRLTGPSQLDADEERPVRAHPLPR